ncbi:MAG: DMT family transporter [Pseudomonadota bacterium]
MPLLFVVLWSTGFIGAKLGTPYAPPMTLLALRFGLVAVCLMGWMIVTGAPWPTARQWWEQAVIATFVHVIYLGGVFVAVDLGLEAGATAVVLGLQPLAIAFGAAAMLGERLNRVQWIGMALGLAGVALVVGRKLDAGIGGPASLAFALMALAAISLGTILQKRRSEDTPMLTGNMVQFTWAAILSFAAALVFEEVSIHWTPVFIFALGWMVIVLSLGALTLYYILIKRGAASEVASLFFLVPASTAVIAWPLFGEVMGLIEIAGMVAAMVGVLLVLRPGLISRSKATG